MRWEFFFLSVFWVFFFFPSLPWQKEKKNNVLKAEQETNTIKYFALPAKDI